jgi:serine phosphatase RsbU (regulator of sigma subunit)/DNA-binding transcriptional regulator YhcF (GntR family)
MPWVNERHWDWETIVGGACKVSPNGRGCARLAKDLLSGRYRPEQSVQLREIAEEYRMDNDSVLKVFAEFQMAGIVTLSEDCSAVVHSLNAKEMQEAYELRAALEEIAGRSAATQLKGSTAGLQNDLEAMRAAIREGNLDAYAEHYVTFHRSILKASGNQALLRVWETLGFDLRISLATRKISKDLPEVVESHQPIVDALEKGRGREAALLMRNHVETFLEHLRKSESDSGIHRAIRKDLDGAKDVQQAFFPPRSLCIPCISCETFYQPAHGIGGDYYDLLSLPGGRWGIAIGDVSGKGIGAALLMASLQASLRAQVLHPHLDLSTLIGDVNRLVYECYPADFFATLFYAEYEPATRVLKYVNAGHNAPMVVRPRYDSCEMYHLTSGGQPVGISPNSELTTTIFQFEIGDVLVAYTDGITEAENPRSDQWGEQRLERLLRSCSRESPERIVNGILDEVSAFADGQPQRDDATLVVMSVQEGCDV